MSTIWISIKVKHLDWQEHKPKLLTRPQCSWLLILPVDLSARALSRQRFLLLDRALHHVSLCSSRLNSSREPEKDRVAPLRPIALRRSSQWRNHQILERKSLNSRNRPQWISVYWNTLKAYWSVLENVPQNLLRVPYIPERFSLLTVTPLDTWLTSNCTLVTFWIPLHLSVTSTSSSCSTNLLMRGVTTASLERDPPKRRVRGVTMHTFSVVSPAAITICFTCTSCMFW